MAYLWLTSNQQIQDVLDANSTIKVGDAGGDNFSSAQAESIENGVVAWVVGFFEPGWVITTASTPGEKLLYITAQLTAARIGEVRLAHTIGQNTDDWTKTTRNEIYGMMSRLMVNQDLVDLDGLAKNTSMTGLRQRLVASKIRQPFGETE